MASRKPSAPKSAPAPSQTQAQPGAETVEAAGPAIIVVGPRKGFRRGGLQFGATPTELVQSDWQTVEAAARLLAILAEPNLTCTLRQADGTQVPISAELIDELREALAAQQDED